MNTFMAYLKLLKISSFRSLHSWRYCLHAKAICFSRGFHVLTLPSGKNFPQATQTPATPNHRSGEPVVEVLVTRETGKNPHNSLLAFSRAQFPKWWTYLTNFYTYVILLISAISNENLATFHNSVKQF